MPQRASSLTGTAGEHYVAYKLAAMGYLAAMTRGGSPTVDIMVGDREGKSAVMIQVKTSNWAFRPYKRKPENNHWEWDVGEKARHHDSDTLFYAFVDLRWSTDVPSIPEVFIVPSKVVKDALGEGWSRYMFWIIEEDREKYCERWDLIVEKLGG